MDIKILSERLHKRNSIKGFNSRKLNIGETLMLITSDLSESLEADRLNRYANVTEKEKGAINSLDNKLFKKKYQKKIDNTFEAELADAVIRIFGFSERMKIDL